MVSATVDKMLDQIRELEHHLEEIKQFFDNEDLVGEQYHNIEEALNLCEYLEKNMGDIYLHIESLEENIDILKRNMDALEEVTK